MSREREPTISIELPLDLAAAVLAADAFSCAWDNTGPDLRTTTGHPVEEPSDLIYGFPV